MARKMKKFSAGGAQGRYDRRMADIEKDYAKAMTRKTGKAAEVAEAKRQQRIADAKDDLAKRTGADRTATRAAEKLAESNLTKTRKYGAPQAVSKLEPIASEKITETLSLPKSGLATSTKKAEVKKAPAKPKPSAADTKRDKFFQDSLRKGDIKRTQLGLSNAPSDQGFSRKSKVLGTSTKTDTKTPTKTTSTTSTGTGTSRLAKAADPKDKSNSAQLARLGAAFSYLNPFSYAENRARRLDPSEVNKAKGGKVMKYAKGGSTSSRPTPKKPMPKEPVTGGANTVPLTPERKEFLKELAKRNAKPGMAKGGKAKSFAATKFGKAMVKKSADTKGRAMVKKAGGGKCYAKGGSIDGIAIKGKTKAKRVTMKKGGSC
jgi:hypothetical protein